jgi:hypothetical protein
LQIDLLSLVAAIGAGVAYIVHPDETTKDVLIAASSCFLTLVRPGAVVPGSSDTEAKP